MTERIGVDMSARCRNGLFIAILLSLLFCGCYPQGSVLQTEIYEPYRIAEANIPHADMGIPAIIDQVVQIEMDDYGRRLFRLREASSMMADDIELYVISQKTDEKYVFYYADYCYFVFDEMDKQPVEQKIQELKNCNDWNLPVDPEKLSKVSLENGNGPPVVYHEEFSNVFRCYAGLDESFNIWENGLEKRSESEQLFSVSVTRKDTEDGMTLERRYYLVFYNAKEKSPIIACEEIENVMNCNDQVHVFRKIWLAPDA